MNITFIFDRCHRSSAAETPVKYTRDSKNLRGTVARSKMLLAEKLTDGDSVTPLPWTAEREVHAYLDGCFHKTDNGEENQNNKDQTLTDFVFGNYNTPGAGGSLAGEITLDEVRVSLGC